MPPFSIREKSKEYKDKLDDYGIVVDADDERSPVKEIRLGDKPAEKIKCALKCATLPFVKLGKKIKFNHLSRNRVDIVQKIVDKYGFDINVKKKIYDMSVSEKQTVEIIKTLYRGADILILDEPTAVLTPQETKKLFDVLRKMRDDGKSIIIITHKLNEVLEISDRVAVLRKGEYIGTVDTKDATESSLTEMMVAKRSNLISTEQSPSTQKKGSRFPGSLAKTAKEYLRLTTCRLRRVRAKFWVSQVSRAAVSASFWNQSRDFNVWKTARLLTSIPKTTIKKSI